MLHDSTNQSPSEPLSTSLANDGVPATESNTWQNDVAMTDSRASRAVDIVTLVERDGTECNDEQGNAVKRKSRLAAATTTCVICQEEKTNRAKWARATACGHVFCWRCIERWSKRCSQCPLCKTEMGSLITARPCATPASKRRKTPQDASTCLGSESKPDAVTAIPVPQRRLQVPEDAVGFEPGSEEDSLVCRVCTLGDNEAALLLCDNCDAPYHTYCLPSPLASVPIGYWCCHDCVAERKRKDLPCLGRQPGRSAFLGPGNAMLRAMGLAPEPRAYAKSSMSSTPADASKDAAAEPSATESLSEGLSQSGTSSVTVEAERSNERVSSSAGTLQPQVATGLRSLRRLKRCA